MQQQLSKKTPVKYAFVYCRTEQTKHQYRKRLKWFFDYIGLEVEGQDLEQQAQAFLDNARQDPEWATQQIMLYLDYQKQRVLRKEITSGSLKAFWRPIRTFTNAFKDVANNIDWKRILHAMPRPKEYASDRIPTLEELRKVVEYPDRRIKAIVYTMVSSGIRIGAWNYLKWKHISPIEDKKTGEIQAAKIIVYADEPEEYFSFITPEAYHAIKAWIDFRARYGEKITGDSWVLRDMFAVADIRREQRQKSGARMVGGNTGRLHEPQKLNSTGVNRILIRAFYEEGIRENLTGTDRRRHEFKGAHSMRKYFKTRAETVMNRLNVEFLMGHSIGLNSNYYRPTQQELLQDYLKAVPALQINDQSVHNLKEQQEALERRQQDKDKELEQMKAKMDIMMSNMASLMQYVSGKKEVVDLIAVNEDMQQKKSEEENRQDLLKLAEIARARNEELAKNKKEKVVFRVEKPEES